MEKKGGEVEMVEDRMKWEVKVEVEETMERDVEEVEGKVKEEGKEV